MDNRVCSWRISPQVPGMTRASDAAGSDASKVRDEVVAAAAADVFDVAFAAFSSPPAPPIKAAATPTRAATTVTPVMIQVARLDGWGGSSSSASLLSDGPRVAPLEVRRSVVSCTISGPFGEKSYRPAHSATVVHARPE